MWQHVVLCRPSVVSSVLHITKSLQENQALNVFNNVILTRNRQLPDDDRMIDTRWRIFKSFHMNNLSVRIGWCTDKVKVDVIYFSVCT